jgi:hypothetical protein
MSNEANPQPTELQSQTADYVAAAAKSVIGAVPFAGSLLVEIAGAIIPNQRIERIAKFAAILDGKIAHLEQTAIRSKLADENFTDLAEEALRQAARSLTDERRDYIASIVASGLSSEDIQLIELKHLLRILGEINDVEVIWLRSFLVPIREHDWEFRHKHEEILKPVHAFFRGPQSQLVNGG